MNPERAETLVADFIHFRQLQGWPDNSVYTHEDLAYFDMLEAERLAGRFQIEGEAQTWTDGLLKEFLEYRLTPIWCDMYETHDEEDRKYIMTLEDRFEAGELKPVQPKE